MARALAPALCVTGGGRVEASWQASVRAVPAALRMSVVQVGSVARPDPHAAGGESGCRRADGYRVSANYAWQDGQRRRAARLALQGLLISPQPFLLAGLRTVYRTARNILHLNK